MKLSFFIFLLFLSSNLLAQITLMGQPKKEDFYTSITHHFYQIGENEKALSFFKMAEKAKVKIRSFDYAHATKIAYRLHRQKDVKKYIEKSILSGMEIEDIKDDSLFNHILQLPVNQNFINDFSKIRNKYLASLDVD